MQAFHIQGRTRIGSHVITDYELFNCMTLLVLPLYFALSTIETQDQYNRYIFYVVLVAMTWIQLLWYLVFHGPQKTRWTPRWDSNLNLSKLVIAGTAVGGIVSINALIIMLGNMIGNIGQVSLLGFQLSLAPVTSIPPWQSWQLSLFPPIFGTEPLNPQVLAWLPLPFANMLQDGLWQTFSVGLAEETLKLTVILVLAKRFQAKIWPILIVVATWSIAHDIRAYNGNAIAIAGAFAGGLILWGVLIITECLLAAVVCHAGVNILASLGSYGFSLGSLLPSVGLIVVLSVCVSKNWGGSVWFGKAQIGEARKGEAQQGTDWHGPTQMGAEWNGAARCVTVGLVRLIRICHALHQNVNHLLR